jgi:hypothetical protein
MASHPPVDAYNSPELNDHEFIVGDPKTTREQDFRSIVINMSIMMGPLSRGIPGYALAAAGGLGNGRGRSCGKTACSCSGKSCDRLTFLDDHDASVAMASVAIGVYMEAAGPPLIGSRGEKTTAECKELFVRAGQLLASGEDPILSIASLYQMDKDAARESAARLGIPRSLSVSAAELLQREIALAHVE